MKLLVILVVILIIKSMSVAEAQTLEFSQVLILTVNVEDTVPSGKVWKVESAVYNSYSINYNSSCKVQIDGTTTEIIPFSFYDGNSYGRSPFSTAFPMWLPEGTRIKPMNATSKMFVVEFNVVP